MTVIKEPFIKCSFLISPVSSSLFNALLTVAGDNPFSFANMFTLVNLCPRLMT